jgi:hypothetical protein
MGFKSLEARGEKYDGSNDAQDDPAGHKAWFDSEHGINFLDNKWFGFFWPVVHLACFESNCFLRALLTLDYRMRLQMMVSASLAMGFTMAIPFAVMGFVQGPHQ